VFFDKVAKKMQKDIKIYYQPKQINKIKDPDERQQKYNVQEAISYIFAEDISYL